ncbi:MFS transporter [Rhodopila sp.]|uniref:MFS transporter n=1 Tax=Rhodopila sp. TaxID=2480087 RepID=UPI002B8C3208|nr:MFS transporter [Rhodopila sp.]HVZ08683.1 MFS transporter [Rhodopila sp.]
MLTVVLAQVLLAFNVVSLPVALGGMVESFQVPPTTIATSIVVYSLAVAAFVMLGAKLNQRFGALRMFRFGVAAFGIVEVVMTVSPTATIMLISQLLCGLAAALLVPGLVALIAENYRGRQQETALGALGSAAAGAALMAFLVGGFLGTYVGWRVAFALLVVLSAVVLVLSRSLRPDHGRPDVRIDGVGAALAAAAIMLISIGFNNLNGWGLGIARPAAPFSLFGLSPAAPMILLGGFLGQCFLAWTRRREAAGKTPLLALSVIESRQERAAVYAMFSIGALEAALNFLVPLYIQIVQGGSALATAVAMMPFNLTVFFTATLVVRLYGRMTPRRIGQCGFALCAVALLWLSFSIGNDWETLPVIAGLCLFGIGQGMLVTLLFNVLVSASPKQLAGDVGSLRGTTGNLATAVGTAVIGALVVAVLGGAVMRELADNPHLPPVTQWAARGEFDLSAINFISNDKLADIMSRTAATPDQVREVTRINIDARLRALKIGLLALTGVALLAILPAGWLPAYKPEALTAEDMRETA